MVTIAPGSVKQAVGEFWSPTVTKLQTVRGSVPKFTLFLKGERKPSALPGIIGKLYRRLSVSARCSASDVFRALER
jgi:hypothetical protein